MDVPSKSTEISLTWDIVEDFSIIGVPNLSLVFDAQTPFSFNCDFLRCFIVNVCRVKSHGDIDQVFSGRLLFRALS